MPPAKRFKKDAGPASPTPPTRVSARLRDKATSKMPSSETTVPTATAPKTPTSSTIGTAVSTPATKKARGKAQPTTTPRPAGKKPKKPKVKGVAPPGPPSALWVNEDCLREISLYLGTGDICQLLTLNRAFYNAATPHLYRVVKQRARCACQGLLDRDEELVAKYTTAIEFFPHSHRTHLPRLKTGRITTHIVNFDWNDNSTFEDKHGRTAAWGNHKCPQCPRAPAPPKRLVLRPVFSAAFFPCPGAKKAKYIALPLGTKCADKTVHISLNTKVTFSNAWHNHRSHPRPVAPTKRLTFVIFPVHWNSGFVFAGSSPLGLLDSILYALACFALQLHDHTIRIVGLEDHDPFVNQTTWSSRKFRVANSTERFKTKLDQRMCLQPIAAWSDEDKNRVRSKITFMTFREYLENGDWGEELAWPLVGRWLNALHARENGLMKTPVLPLTKAEKKKKAAQKAAAAKRRRKRKYETESESEWDSADDTDAEMGNSSGGPVIEAEVSEEEDY